MANVYNVVIPENLSDEDFDKGIETNNKIKVKQRFTISNLKTSTNVPKLVFITDSNKEGWFLLDETDTTSVNDDVNTIVTSTGKRYKKKTNQVLPTGTSSQVILGDKTLGTLNKSLVGLDNVNNTSDLSKPISTSTQTALDVITNNVNTNTTTANTAKTTADTAIAIVNSSNLQGIDLGVWNASTNTPTLTSTPLITLVDGSFYTVTVAGTQSITGSSTAFSVRDVVKKFGTTWVRIPNVNRIDNAGDTLVNLPVDGDLLQRDGVNSLWKNISSNLILLGNKGLVSFDNSITIDRSIATAIKSIRFENVTNSVQWAVSQIGWNGTNTIITLRNLSTSASLFVTLETGGAEKPTGIKRYVSSIPYNYHLDIVVDWSSFSVTNLISTTYTTLVQVIDYNNERNYPSNLKNGIVSFTRNGTDERIALAVKSIQFEYLDGNTPFSIAQIGWNGTNVVLILRNLTTNSNYTIVLSLDTAKPSGLKQYELSRTGEMYLKLLIDWDSYPSQSILSSTFTTVIQVGAYQSFRDNQLDSVDTNNELFRLNASKRFVNQLIDFSQYRLETGSITSGQNSVNNNRLRTKYSIRVKAGSTINYTIASNYKILIHQVQTTGVKTFVLLKDSGALSGTGTLVLDTNVTSIRVTFLKFLTDGTTETVIQSSDVNSSNFAITTDFSFVDIQNQPTSFTDNQLINSFIKELFIEGLDKTQPYIISHIRRNVTGSWRLYIKNKNTNTIVFQFGVNPAYDFSETGIFDRTLNSIRVRAVFDWSVLPVGYHNLEPTTQINLKNEYIFNLKYSPSISAFYRDKVIRGDKLLSDRMVGAIDKNTVSNSILPHKFMITAFMNSMNADLEKASSIVSYDTIAYAKNGSVGLEIDGKVYEFCQERDTDIYDSTSNIFVRVVDLATKTMISKTKVLGFDDTIGGVAMTKIPYCYAGAIIDASTIRLFIRVRTSTIDKFGYIDFNITNLSFTSFADMTLNGTGFDISSYYTYIRDNVDNTLTTSYSNLLISLSLGKHIQKSGSYYYALLSSAVGLNPYSGTYMTIIRSADGVNWTTLYCFSDYRNCQDDGDMYIKDGILYAQLRQTFGTLSSVIVAYNISTGKEITSQIIKTATCRAEFFEHNGSLYLFVNLDENRQYAVLYRIIYSSGNESIDLATILTTEGWSANWSIHSYNSKIYVFFGVQVWELKMDAYNTSVSTNLFNLLK